MFYFLAVLIHSLFFYYICNQILPDIMKSLSLKFISIFWVLCITVNAQTGIFYSTDKDLSNSLINSIYQDKRDYIWIATEDGLNKFDGVKFSVYKNNQKDVNSLKNNYVRCLFEDSKGRFWIGGINGLQLFDRKTNKFTTVNLYSSGNILHPHVTSIIESADGTIWLSTSGEGVIRMLPEKNSRFEVDDRLNAKIPSLHLMFIFQDKYHQLWIGTENHGLCMFDNVSGSIRLFDVKKGNIGNNQMSAIAEDSKSNIFVGTLSGGLYRLNKVLWKFESIQGAQAQNPLPVKSLHIDKQKQLLVGTDGLGLKKYNYGNDRIEDYRMSASIFDFSKMKVHSILQDRTGNLWIGLFQKGIFLLRNNPYRFSYIGSKFFDQNLIGSSSVTAIYKDKNNHLWIGTDNDGMYQLDNQNKARHFVRTNTPNSISSTVMSIVETPGGEMWLGSYLHGLALFNKNTGECTYFNEKPDILSGSTFENKINAMITDNNNRLWIGTHGEGIFVFDTQIRKYVKHYSFPYITNDWINCLFYDKNGSVWAGTHKGFSVIHTQKDQVDNFSENNPILPGKVIYSIVQDRKGEMWIGSTEGIAILNIQTKTTRKLSTENGLASDVICGIVEDSGGNMWMSTHNGISKYNVDKNTFTNYYSSDGLQGNEFTKGAFFKTSDDEIFFGGINGVNSFYPEQIKEGRESVKLYVTALNIGDREVFNNRERKNPNRFISDLDTIFLDYKENIFNLEFSTFNFGIAEQIHYRYKMEGLSDTWISTNPGVNRIHFTNINYGTYKLKVMASVRDIQSEIREITIIISPPWYLSGWAIFGYVVLGLLLIYGVASYFLNRIKHRNELMKRQHAEQLNEAKLQYFINISHEIRTPMSLIISPLEKLIPAETDPEKSYLYQIMHRNAKRILRLINQLMDIRKIDKGQLVLQFRETDMVGFIKDLMQTFEYTAKKRNMDFQFTPDQPELKVWIDLNNMDKVMMNILSNAFKFTPDNGKITVMLHTGANPESDGPLKNYFEIIVSDSGIGINESDLENVFTRFYQIDNVYTKSQIGTGVGLHLSRSLVEMSHGIIFARDKAENSGCEFVIRLPLGSSHLSQQEKISELSLSDALPPVHNTQNDELEIISEDAPDEMTEVKPKTKYRIAIVEDDYEIRNYLKVELLPYVRVDEFYNGKEALQHVLTHKPDLVLSDVMMPEMDGLTLCKKIKTNPTINHIPVILLTAKTTDMDKAEGFEIGADAYVSKPFNIELLTKQILNLIENRRRVELKPLEEENNKKLITTEPLKSSDKKLLEKILKLINENISSGDLNVDFLSKSVGMSRVHMYRKVKELTNQSTHDFIKTIRMKKASEMLSGQKINISEVAYALGFSNLSHFSNVFKDFYGISPKEYSEKHRQQDEAE